MTFGCNQLIELITAFDHNKLIKLTGVTPSSNLIVRDREAVVKQQLFTFGQSALAIHRFISVVGLGLIVSIDKIAATAKIWRQIKHAAPRVVGMGYSRATKIVHTVPQFIISLPRCFTFIR
jgi:hypothetical protein